MLITNRPILQTCYLLMQYACNEQAHTPKVGVGFWSFFFILTSNSWKAKLWGIWSMGSFKKRNISLPPWLHLANGFEIWFGAKRIGDLASKKVSVFLPSPAQKSYQGPRSISGVEENQQQRLRAQFVKDYQISIPFNVADLAPYLEDDTLKNPRQNCL